MVLFCFSLKHFSRRSFCLLLSVCCYLHRGLPWKNCKIYIQVSCRQELGRKMFIEFALSFLLKVPLVPLLSTVILLCVSLPASSPFSGASGPPQLQDKSSNLGRKKMFGPVQPLNNLPLYPITYDLRGSLRVMKYKCGALMVNLRLMRVCGEGSWRFYRQINQHLFCINTRRRLQLHYSSWELE